MVDKKKLESWSIKELIARTEYIIGQLENTDLDHIKYIYKHAVKTLEKELRPKRDSQP